MTDSQKGNLTDEQGENEESVSVSSESDVHKNYRILTAILEKASARYRRDALAEGALWYASSIIASILGVLLLSLLFPGFIATYSFYLVSGGIVAATVVALIALIHFHNHHRDIGKIASLLQHHHAEFRNDLVAALEFGKTLTQADGQENKRSSHIPYSIELASAHIGRTVRKALASSNEGDLSHLLPKRNFKPSAITFITLTIAILVVFAYAPQTIRTIFIGTNSVYNGEGENKLPVQPVIGEISLRYTFPSYTGYEQRAQNYTTGHIEAIVGTQITLQTYPLVEAERFELVMQYESGEKLIPLFINDVGVLQANFSVSEPATYWIRAHVNEHLVVEDRIERMIRVLPDKTPEITITSHESEVEVRPDDILEFYYNISDDYGIASIQAAHHFAMDDTEVTRHTVQKPELNNFPSNVDGTYSFDLSPLGLQPKDVVVFYIEAHDNNTVTGPGIGKSQAIILRVSSPEDKHLQNLADQQALIEALLMHLADFLETPLGQREKLSDSSYRQRVDANTRMNDEQYSRFHRLHAIHNQRKPILDEMGKLAQRLADDPLMRVRNVSRFTALYEQLQVLHTGGDATFEPLIARAQAQTMTRTQLQRVADYASRAEDELEKGILRFEDLLASQKLDAIQATADSIRELKDRLRELLEQYRDTQDDALKEAIRREIHRLRQRMHELMARMQEQMKKLPEEHVNMQAVQQAQMESESKQLADNLDSIEELLENGDIDGALEALDRMEASLDSLTQDMDEQFESAMPQGVSELDKALAEMMDRVSDLEALERSIEEDTRQLQQDITERRQKEMEQKLNPFTEEMLRKVAEQQRGLDSIMQRELPSRDQGLIEHARQRLNSLQQMLEVQDIQQSLEQAKSSLESLRSLRMTMELSQRYTPQESAQYGELSQASRDVQRMIPRGEDVVDSLQEMMDSAQERLNAEEQQRMRELEERQAQASEQCDGVGNALDDASERFPMLEQQLRPGVEQAQQSMRQAQQSLQNHDAQGALDQERQALEQLGQLRQSMRDALQQQRNQEQRQGQRQQSEKVEIPGQDSRQNHEQFRREILEGMREGRLEEYEQDIERYYRDLME